MKPSSRKRPRVVLAEMPPGQRILLPTKRRARVVGASWRESRSYLSRLPMMEVQIEQGEDAGQTFTVAGSILVQELAS